MGFEERAVAFLRKIEVRDVAEARQYLAADARFVFPRGAEFADLDACLADRHTRYQRAHKNIERVDVLSTGPEAAVVYVVGTLEGSRLDGTSFSGVRFIDRFTFKDGAIVLQEVWNDLTFV